MQAPRVDEQALPGESPHATACRLALAKAKAVALARPGAIVIGSDQVADVDGEALSKPGSHEVALAQLTRMQAEIYNIDRIRALENALIESLAHLPEDTKEEFFRVYEQKLSLL